MSTTTQPIPTLRTSAPAVRNPWRVGFKAAHLAQPRPAFQGSMIRPGALFAPLGAEAHGLAQQVAPLVAARRATQQVG